MTTQAPATSILASENQAKRDEIVELLTRSYWMEIETVMNYVANSVNPDGIRNQVEGGIVQSLSWTAFEAAGHDGARRTDYDWSTYPILRFAAVPRSVTVEVIDRPGTPFLGTGECAQGPMAAALANALAAATGVRVRTMPLARGPSTQT